jgi:predicted Zn-dependent peptidase
MHKKDIKKINNYTYYYNYKETVSYFINMSFIFETTKRNNIILQILSRYLKMINDRYKNLKEYNNIRRDLYNIELFSMRFNYKDNSIFKICMRMLDPKKVKDNYFEKAIDFFHDIFSKPYFINNKLDKEKMNIIKNDIYNDYLDFEKNFHFEVYSKYDLMVRPNQIRNELEYYKDSNELREILDSITDEEIIDFYNKLFNNFYKMTIMGNLNKKEIDYIVNKLKFNRTNVKKIEYLEELDLKKEYNEYISKDYTQSVLCVTYKTNNFKKYSKDDVIDNIINIMSNSKEGLFLGLLREKYGLAYGGDASFYYDNGLFRLSAHIDKKNKDKALDVVREYIDIMHNKKIVGERLKFAKEKLLIKESLSSEDTIFMLNKLESYVYEDMISDKEYVKRINAVKTEDIIEFIDSLENENIFYYKGDKDE